MGVVEMTRAAWLRQRKEPSRSVCYVCGLRFLATIHGTDTWWQHEFEPGILTRVH
jgi:hypothetical protein